jgi:CheY-like chemotaxis protein
LAEQQEESFVEYEWTMPGKTGSGHIKLSYFKRFAPYNLAIGTGLYLEDIEAAAKQELKQEITNTRYGANGYFFINDFHGMCWRTACSPNWWVPVTGITQIRVETCFSRICARRSRIRPVGSAAIGGKMPETGEERPKIAFAMGIPEWEWLIGTGLYVDEVDADIKEMQAQMLRQSIQEISLVLLMTASIIVLVLLFMRARFRGLRRDIRFFEDCCSRAAYQDVSIDESRINFIELLKIARNANSMLREKLKSEEQRLQIKKLESVGVLAGGIAHDFNNLLTGLMGNIDLAKSYIKPDHPAYPYITLESAPGKGASFIIRLPASHEPLPQKPSGMDEEQVANSRNDFARILVVDDMELVRKMLTSALKKAGYEVDAAQDGVEAQKKYEQAMEAKIPFDLVITDLTIPGGQGGEELARHLLAFDPDARIIVSSGYSDSPVMSRYRDFGFVGCIAKPYSMSNLRQTIREVLADSRLDRASV